MALGQQFTIRLKICTASGFLADTSGEVTVRGARLNWLLLHWSRNWQLREEQCNAQRHGKTTIKLLTSWRQEAEVLWGRWCYRRCCCSLSLVRGGHIPVSRSGCCWLLITTTSTQQLHRAWRFRQSQTMLPQLPSLDMWGHPLWTRSLENIGPLSQCIPTITKPPQMEWTA
jgi:hypothetical protein